MKVRVKGLLGLSLVIAFIFLLHIMNGVVVAIYGVAEGTAGVLTSLMTVAEVIVLAAWGDLRLSVKIKGEE